MTELFEQKPISFNAEASYMEGEKLFHLYLDLKVDGKIFGLYFTQENLDRAALDMLELCQAAASMNIDQLLEKSVEMGSEDLFHLPSYLLLMAVENYYERPYSYQLKKENIYQLICRCRGIYQNELESFFQDQPLATEADIAANDGCAAVCGSCLEDVLNIQEKLGGDFMALKQVERIKLIQKALERFLRKENLEGELIITENVGTNFYLKADFEMPKDLFIRCQEFLKEEFFTGLNYRLEDF